MSARVIDPTALLLARLTGREREVCDLLARGFVDRQIAHELDTSEHTVKSHRGRIMHKLEVDSVTALVELVRFSPGQRRSFDR